MVTLRDFLEAVSATSHNLFSWPKQTKFEKRMKDGASFYEKPQKNPCSIRHIEPNYDRRIMSKRVFTHTKK